MIVDLYNSAHLVKKLSSEYGVSDVTIYAWIKKFSPIEMEDGPSITPDDYNKLQKQMLKIQRKMNY
ncbi:helix-turn-helix domain-containing protein [Cerasibacillus terrae]|uniref:Helix-turn-helix domain-containing protein n=1 Tax=Cerasibacillus terrae TaxID=2498845 RepID=A0A5C8P0J5_9BACI|nr:helix-turn-helix domain-containing protein [Cerasibacillus terrae]